MEAVGLNAPPFEVVRLVRGAYSRRELTAAEAINMMSELYDNGDTSEELFAPPRA
jgi:hypothetical protein